MSKNYTTTSVSPLCTYDHYHWLAISSLMCSLPLKFEFEEHKQIYSVILVVIIGTNLKVQARVFHLDSHEQLNNKRSIYAVCFWTLTLSYMLTSLLSYCVTHLFAILSVCLSQLWLNVVEYTF